MPDFNCGKTVKSLWKDTGKTSMLFANSTKNDKNLTSQVFFAHNFSAGFAQFFEFYKQARIAIWDLLNSQSSPFSTLPNEANKFNL